MVNVDAEGHVRRLAFGLACFVLQLKGIDGSGTVFKSHGSSLDSVKAFTSDADPRAALLHELASPKMEHCQYVPTTAR